MEFEVTGGMGADVFNVYSCERSHPYDSSKVFAVSAAQAMSQVLNDHSEGGHWRTRLSFAPPDVGLRFWQVFIIIDRETNLGPGLRPAMNITATCY